MSKGRHLRHLQWFARQRQLFLQSGTGSMTVWVKGVWVKFVQRCCTDEDQFDASKVPIETWENLQQNVRAKVRMATVQVQHQSSFLSNLEFSLLTGVEILCTILQNSDK